MKPDRVTDFMLLPGAGGDRSHHTFVALEQGLDPLIVHRRDFTYRAKGKRPPPKAPVLIDEIIGLVAQLDPPVAPELLLLGGRSLGGRMCSMAVAEGLPAAGLVLLSYPLHPPGKPERVRTEHFPQIEVPCLFVSGDRDPFGTSAEFERHATMINGPVTFAWLAGKGHDPKGCDDEIVTAVKNWLETLG